MRHSVCANLLVAAALSCLTASGCVLETPLSVHRVWADYNTLCTPAVYCEKVSHVPIDSARVREIRAMYNAGPHDTGGTSLIPAPQGTWPRMIPAAPGRTTNLPPSPDKLQSPDDMKARTPGPVADLPRPTERTARSSDEWRFVH